MVGATLLKFSGFVPPKVNDMWSKFERNLKTPMIPLYTDCFCFFGASALKEALIVQRQASRVSTIWFRTQQIAELMTNLSDLRNLWQRELLFLLFSESQNCIKNEWKWTNLKTDDEFVSICTFGSVFDLNRKKNHHFIGFVIKRYWQKPLKEPHIVTSLVINHSMPLLFIVCPQKGAIRIRPFLVQYYYS